MEELRSSGNNGSDIGDIPSNQAPLNLHEAGGANGKGVDCVIEMPGESQNADRCTRVRSGADHGPLGAAQNETFLLERENGEIAMAKLLVSGAGSPETSAWTSPDGHPEWKATESRLREQIRRLQDQKAWHEAILGAIGEGISIQTIDYRILYQNRRHRELMGDHVGEECFRAFGRRESVCEDCHLRRAVAEDSISTVERRVEVEGEQRYYEITVSPLRDTAGKVVAGVEVIRDITARKQVEEKLRYMSSHDVLTGLYNRSYFEHELDRLVQGRHYPLSVIMADVDDLKIVNDSRGHAAGDELLAIAAYLIRESFRSEDIVARIGGDEFAVLLPDTDASAAEEVMARIRQTVEAWNREHEFPVNLSIGCGTAQQSDQVPNALRLADSRMYDDKMARTGRAPRRTECPRQI